VDWWRPQTLSADSRLRAAAIELGQVSGAQFLGHVSGGKTVACHLPQVFVGNPKRSLDRGVVLVDVATEIRRIIRIDGDANAARVQLANVVRLHVGKHTQRNVGAGTNSQRRTLLGEPAHKIWISIAAYAVVNAIDLERIEGVSNIVGPTLLASVSDSAPSEITARDRKRAPKFCWRMADLRPSKTEAKDVVAPWLKRGDRGQRVGFIELALNARDQSAGNAVGVVGSIEGGEDVLDDGCDPGANAPAG
jgi:hypothetical protein